MPDARPAPPDPGNRDLLDLIRGEIRTRGPIPFSRFQELALYHPQHGYYTRGAGIGRDGADFWTAPEMSPAFGALLGVQIQEMFHLAGAPERFVVVEVGAGTGALADGLLSAWEEEGSALYRPGVYLIREVSPALRKRQRERLAAHGSVVRWEGVETAPGETAATGEAAVGGQAPDGTQAGPAGVVVMNEVLDALPVDRVEAGEQGLVEIRVGLEGEELAEVRCSAPPELEEELARVLSPGASLAPGQQAELRPAMGSFLAQATRGVGAGYLLVLDYGFPARELYAPHRRAGTLLAYHRHQANDDLLARAGRQDLTAHVDFTALAREVGRLGYAEAGCTTQMRFLLALGLGERIEALEDAPLDEAERTRRRLGLTSLIRPGGMGEMLKVWMGARSAPASLRGLRDPFQAAPWTA